MMINRYRCILFVSFLWVFDVIALPKGDAYLTYIETYKGMAIQQMKKYNIPASITLAQGLLETAAGQSRLATKANNHFGIKVTSDWTGSYILADDDAPNEKFRKYRSAADSYEDHSLFLRKHPRYAPLFKLSITDYKGWARTLKKCGYATDPNYANNLIRIIERYNLSQYDKGGKKSKKQKNQYLATYTSEQDFFNRHTMGRQNGLYYIVAAEGDNLKLISKYVNKKASSLRKYNEILKDDDVLPGDYVYLSEKKSRAGKEMKGVPHIVQPDETIHSISQKYGVKMSSIYKKNSFSPDHSIMVGDELYVY